MALVAVERSLSLLALRASSRAFMCRDEERELFARRRPQAVSTKRTGGAQWHPEQGARKDWLTGASESARGESW